MGALPLAHAGQASWPGMNTTETFDFSEISFLVADSNAYMRELTVSMLRSVGVRRYWEAGDAAQALRQVKTHEVDIALIDWMLTPVDGLEAVRQIRTSPHSPNRQMTIIMMSAHTEEWRVCKARDTGVNEFLARPLSLSTLGKRLVRCLDSPRMFVKCESYFGPDRRRHTPTSATNKGRRVEDAQLYDADGKPVQPEDGGTEGGKDTSCLKFRATEVAW